MSDVSVYFIHIYVAVLISMELINCFHRLDKEKRDLEVEIEDLLSNVDRVEKMKVHDCICNWTRLGDGIVFPSWERSLISLSATYLKRSKHSNYA